MRLATLEELDRLRLRTPSLVDAFDSHDPAFADEVKKWLDAVERVLIVHRLGSAGSVAALRAAVIAAARGAMPEGVALAGKITRRKIRDAVSAGVLRKAEDVIADVTRPAAAQVAEADRFLRQMTAVARQKGLLASNPSGVELWAAMQADPELGPVAVHVIGLAGVADAVTLLDRVVRDAEPSAAPR